MRSAVVARYTRAMTMTLFLVLSAAMCLGAGLAGWTPGRASAERRLFARDPDTAWLGGHEVATPVAEREGRP